MRKLTGLLAFLCLSVCNAKAQPHARTGLSKPRFVAEQSTDRSAPAGILIARNASISRIAPAARIEAGSVSVTATAGTASGTYSTLKAAFDAINAGTHLGAITISIDASTTETATAILNAGAYTSVLIKPNGAQSISGNITGPLVQLNGADNVTIDGLNTGGNSLLLINTSTSTTSTNSTIRITSDASSNTIDHCTIINSYPSSASSGSGCISISSPVTTGNDNITIKNSRIGGNGTNACASGVIASGSSSVFNDNLVIQNNDFENIINTTVSAGVYINTGTPAPLITGNRFYHTQAWTVGGTATHYGIMFNNAASRADIMNNVIGFASSAGTGLMTIYGTSSFTFRGINIANSITIAPTVVSGNTIAGIDFASNKTTTGTNSSAFAAIDIGALSGGIAVANVIGNTIGSQTGQSISIKVNNTANTGQTCVLNLREGGTGFSVSNNSIGGITQSGGTGVIRTDLFACLVWSTITNSFSGTVQNNIIGGTNAGSITNTIPGQVQLFGMEFYNLTGNVLSNTIRNVGLQRPSGFVGGLLAEGLTLPTSVTNNTIYNIGNNLTGTTEVLGLYLSTSGGTNCHLDQNNVHSLYGAEGNEVYGMNIVATSGSSVFASNNLVRLGTDGAGNNLSAGKYIGLFENVTGTAQLDHNSISISGESGSLSSEPSEALWSASTTANVVARNNIFSNARTNVAGNSFPVAVRYETLNQLAAQYNDLYVAPGSSIAVVSNGATYATLADWQATGRDANSISVNPQFVQPLGTILTGDLHPANSALNAGTPIPTITIDYANNARSATAPTIGAYEISCIVPTASIAYSGTPYCSTTGTASVTFSGTTGGTYSAPAGLVINGATGDINLAASTSGTYLVTYTMTSGCGGTATTSVSVRPTQGITPQINQVLCNGASTAAINFSGIAGATYSWTNSNGSIGIGTSGTGDIAPFTATNSGNTAVTATLTANATVGTGCKVSPMQFRITVKPTPTVNAISSQVLCAGTATAAVNFTGSVTGTLYSWTNDNNATGLGLSGTGNIPSFMAQNNTGTTQVSSLTVTPTATGCVGTPALFSITTNPSVTSITYAASSYCQTGTASPVRVGSAGGTYSATPAGLNLDATTGTINLSASAPGIYTVSYTLAAGCQASASTQLTIKAQASVNPVPNQTYCNGVMTNTITFTGTAASYNWTNDNAGIGLPTSGTGNIAPFLTMNGGPGAQYANMRVTPVGGAGTCPGKALAFRFTINYCGPIAQAGDHGSGGSTGRISTTMAVSPNPATAATVITLTESGQYTWQLINRVGAPVSSPRSFSGNRATIDISALTPGSYLLQVVHVRTGVVMQKQVIKL